MFLALVLSACRAAVQPPARTAEMRIVVADTSKALGAIAQSVEDAGGVVVATDAWREEGRLRATMTFRVTREQLTGTLREVRAVAKRVESEHVCSGRALPGA